jgi:flagellar motor switch protein FliM
MGLPEGAGNFDQVARAAQRSRFSGASTYDFRQTEKFSADQNRFLERLFIGFAENVVTQLAPLLQTRFSMEVISFKSKSYQRYLNDLPDPTPLIVFRLDQDTQAFIDIDFELAFGIFERLLGGKGTIVRDEVRNYLTDLEKSILKRPFSRILAAYTQAWRDYKEVDAQFSSLELNPNAVHICPPSETMVATTFQVDMGQSQGLLNVVIPFRYLKTSVPRSSFDEFVLSRNPTNTSGGPNSMTPMFATKIGSAKVPVSISLGRAELLFRELLSIEVGDTIRLDSEIANPLKIKVNGRTKFLGSPGIKNNKLAARVSKVLEEGDEEYDE